jgi:HD superfamily phosphohydrolase
MTVPINKKSNNKRVFLDPIHGNIELNKGNKEDALISDLIDTQEFQRLRRIRQLGFSSLTFYGAESTRFVHSIGAFYVARQMLNSLEKKNPKLIQPLRLKILLAALLHDIGHGPFSHSSEPAFGFQHEIWTNTNILGKTEINQVLNGYEKNLAKEIVSVLNGAEGWISAIVSSQLDCDRADYLLRDSYQTGTKYGVFQLDRIIQSMELEHDEENNTQLVFSEKGIHAVEDYLFARYSMYLQVYHHKKTLSTDALFQSVICRARDLLLNDAKDLIANESLIKWLLMDKYSSAQNALPPSPLKRGSNRSDSGINLNDFWEVDDICILHHLKLWVRNSKDEILADLSARLLNRNLFKAKKLDQISKKQITEIKNKLGKEKAKYYCLEKECKEFPYSDSKKPILVRKNNEIVELSKASSIAQALINKDRELDIKWFFAPKECFK